MSHPRNARVEVCDSGEVGLLCVGGGGRWLINRKLRCGKLFGNGAGLMGGDNFGKIRGKFRIGKSGNFRRRM